MESIKKFTRSIEDVVSGRSQIEDVRISMDRGTNATGSMINSDDVSLIDASQPVMKAMNIVDGKQKKTADSLTKSN